MDKRNGAAAEPQQTEQKYPTWVEILDTGFEAQIVQTLTDAIQKYASALGADGTEKKETDADSLFNLVWMLKAVLKDCYKIDVEL